MKLSIALTIVFTSIFCSPTTQLPALDEYQRVYLATYARSGNHWMRELIEEATQVMTSSVYIDDDPPHSPKIFPWGGYCPEETFKPYLKYPNSGEIVVIKTHFPASDEQPYDCQPYTKTIRLVRHPIDTFYSFYLYFHKEPSDGPNIPLQALETMIYYWHEFQGYWNEQKDVITVRYEDLYKNPHYYLKFILESIGYRPSNEDINRAVQKHPPRGGLLKHIKFFEPKDFILIDNELHQFMLQFGYGVPMDGSDNDLIQPWNPED